MRSERLAWLRSQGLGLLCGQATVLLLGIGSFVLVATRDGASAGVHLDDLRAFFREPSLAHAWLYLLAGVLALYALNTALCTWDSVVSKWRRGIRELTAYAPPVIHLAFLLALVAHLAGGLFNEDLPPVVLTASRWTDVAPRTQARLASLSAEALPDGRPRRLDAELELRDAGGQTWREPLGYNTPVSRGLGAQLLLLEKAGELPGALRFEIGGEACSAPEGGTCSAGGLQLHVVALRAEGHWGIRPAAILEISDPQGNGRRVMLLEGSSQAVAGRELRFARVDSEQAVLVRRRVAPGNPWALAAALVLAVGLGLMGRRWLWG